MPSRPVCFFFEQFLPRVSLEKRALNIRLHLLIHVKRDCKRHEVATQLASDMEPGRQICQAQDRFLSLIAGLLIGQNPDRLATGTKGVITLS